MPKILIISNWKPDFKLYKPSSIYQVSITLNCFWEDLQVNKYHWQHNIYNFRGRHYLYYICKQILKPWFSDDLENKILWIHRLKKQTICKKKKKKKKILQEFCLENFSPDVYFIQLKQKCLINLMKRKGPV